MDQITQITEVSEEKYLHDQQVRTFACVSDLLRPDEKVVDGELHIKHLDGQYRKLSMKMVSKLFLEARDAAIQANRGLIDAGGGICDCPVCTLERAQRQEKSKETLPTHLTVKEYAEEYGIVLQGDSEAQIVWKAVSIAAARGKQAPGWQFNNPKFAREVLAEVFEPILNRP